MAVTDSFVDGHALRRADVAADQALETAMGDHSHLREMIAAGPYPQMRRNLAQPEGWRPEAAAWMDETFERGLSALLEGLVLQFTQPR